MACKGCQKYVVLRMYSDDRPHEVLAINLTIQEAQEWCRRDGTHGHGWFDGYTKQHKFHVEEFNNK
jgi:hypothetical protein